MTPELNYGKTIIGPHTQRTGESLYFNGVAWWREETALETWTAPGMSGGMLAFVLVAGLICPIIWLALIGNRTRTYAVPRGTGVWTPVTQHPRSSS